MDWVEIRFTVRTPMFLGGAEHEAEFRLAALRGALRYWFRALAAPFVGDDPVALAAHEREIFGTGGRAAALSAVQFKPGRVPAPTPAAGGAEWASSVQYMLGQGLYSYRSGLQRSYLEPSASGHFFVTAPAECRRLVGCLLWCLETLGGLGARVRRGFGGISFQGVNDLGWTPPQLGGAPENVALRLKSSLDACLKTVEKAIKSTQASPTVMVSGSTLEITPCGGILPGFPSFSSWHAQVGALDRPRASDLLSDIGQKLRDHRAPEAGPRKKTSEYVSVVTPWMRSRTAVSDARGRPASSFDLAAFGLPIVFKKDAAVNLFPAHDADDGQLDQELRRASPLWTRPLSVGAVWRPLYHVFSADLFGPHTLWLYNPDGRTQGKPLATDRDPWNRLKRWFSEIGI